MQFLQSYIIDTCITNYSILIAKCLISVFSANDDPKMVMKGIEHGACDYLVKPVRLKEVQIIWQHVIRKKKTSKRSNHDAPNSDSGNGKDSAGTGNSDKNEKPSRKRKDKNEDDSEEENEDDYDNDDQTAQKKPRTVWSTDLHRKFVVAVNQLGIDGTFFPLSSMRRL
jgi:two-component response regulator ARR-B family